MQEKRICLVLLHNQPVFDQHDPVGHPLSEFNFMGNDDHRGALAGKVFHHVQNFLRQLRIQRARRFIEKNHPRLGRDRPGDGDALLLTAGQFGRIIILPVQHPDFFQGFQPDAFRFFFVHPARNRQARRHILERGLVSEQVEGLKNESDLPAVMYNVFPGDPMKVEGFSVQRDRPAVRLREISRAAEQGRFTAAAGAENGHHVPLIHRKADIPDHRMIAKALFHLLQFQHAHRLASSAFSPLCCSTVRMEQIIR